MTYFAFGKVGTQRPFSSLVFQPDVVDMQMGAHDIVDVVHREPSRPEFFSKRSLRIMFQNGRAGRGL